MDYRKALALLTHLTGNGGMVRNRDLDRWLLLAAVVVSLVSGGCASDEEQGQVPLEIPRGYLSVLEIERGGLLSRFGPFVGYYFIPEDPGTFSELRFVCFNERGFYTKDLPRNAQLFWGQARLATLPRADFKLRNGRERIAPVFFPNAPDEWLESRPQPKDEFVHFHSCYNARGALRQGYWLRHVAVAAFTYDMGGRVGPESPLYHRVQPGVDKQFARIVEFDSGPVELLNTAD
jgi:hypothetical protein